MMKHKGFTVVELLVVIVVIGILAGVVLVAYGYVREDGVDTKIRSIVKTAGDAMQLYESQEGSLPTSQGYFNQAQSVDKLVPKYLKQGYRSGVNSKNVSNQSLIFRWHPCTIATSPGAPRKPHGFVIYASLNNPSADEVATFRKIRSDCGHTATQAPDSGATRYNYAQTF